MNKSTTKHSTTKLFSLTGIVSAGIFISLPALAAINPNLFEKALNNGTRSAESNIRTGQLLAQGTSGTSQGGTGATGTGTGQGNTGGTGTGQGNTGGTGTGQGNTGGTGTGQGNTGGTGTGQGNTGGTGTTIQPGTGGTGTTIQPGTGGTGTTIQPGTGGTGTTIQPGTGGTGTTIQPGTGGTGTTGQPATGGTGTGGAGQFNIQGGSYEDYMRIGYTATEQGDYQTALINFRRALNLRPGDPYATRAIGNVEGYIQRNR